MHIFYTFIILLYFHNLYKMNVMNNMFDTLEKNYIVFNKNKINIIMDNQQKIWFHGNQTGDALGYQNAKRTINRSLDPEDKEYFENIVHSQNIKVHRQTVYLNESGLYNLIFISRLPSAKKFKRWVTNDVLPSIRLYGNYKINEELTETKNNLAILQKTNKILRDDIKIEPYPNGGVVYVLDYTENGEEIYRIGKTDNLEKRKKVYKSHTLHNKKIIIYHETKCPLRLESCVRSMLYKNRYENRRDYYVCTKDKVKEAFKICQNSLNCVDKQKGGNNDTNTKNTIDHLIDKKEKEIVKINRLINKINTSKSIFDE